MPKGPQIAVFHHRFKHIGGAERVANALADALNADLYTLYITERCTSDTEATPLRQETYNHPVYGRFFRRLAVENIARSIDAEHVDLDGYDAVVTSGDYAHCYLPTDEQRHFHYLHTPNRDLYNPPEFRALAGGRLRWLKTLYFQWLRGRDQNHAPHVDRWLCNSEFVADRCRRYYDPPADAIEVINPPVEWERLGPAVSADEREEYWVTVGRLVPAKRLDILVEAFDGLDERLIVAGTGGEYGRLTANAPKNVEFTGYVDETRKRELLRRARGFVFAGERECFGMSVAEALSAGTPVVAADSGNMGHLIDGENGRLVEAKPAAVRRAVRRVSATNWDYERIRDDAEQYSVKQFNEQIKRIII